MSRSLPSIRRLLVLLSLACVVPAASLAAALIAVHYQRERGTLEVGAVATARALAASLDDRVRGLQAELVALAQSPLLKAGDLADFHKEAGEVQEVERIGAVVLLSRDGPLIHTKVPFGTPLAAETVPAMQLALQTGQPAISGVFTSPVLRLPVVAVGIPAFGPGSASYALNAHVEAAQLRNVLQRQKLPADWIATIFDGSGAIVARTHDHEKFVGRRGVPPLVRRMADVPEDAIESTTVDGIPVVTAFSRAPISGWTVAIAIPRAGLNAPIRQSQLALLGGALLLLAVTVGLAWVLGSRIAGSIQRLSGATAALGRGESFAAPQAFFREAQQLCEAFAQTASAVAQARGQLEHHVQALTRSNLELQQFAFVASHDLRSPLRSITGYLRLVLDRYGQALDEKARDLLARALRAAGQMDQLVEDLLRYARLENESRPMAEVDCNAVQSGALEALHAAVADSGAEIAARQLPTVWGDRTQLVQLLQNLVGNAIKYCRGRSPRIEVRAERGEAEWVFHVSDNGIGIEPQHLERVFEIFKRLHTQQEFTGTGIGLAVCRRIVERHGGRIWCTSTPGEGSTFSFTIADRRSA